MDRLWAPWRMVYLEETHAPRPDGCVFCQLAEPGDDRQRLVLKRTEETLVVMNKYPYNNGHLLVMPRAHRAHFNELSPEAYAALHLELGLTARAIEAAIGPHGINLGMNLGKSAGAGIPGHMHYHLVPRWDGDTNFMPVIGETKVISQHILETYDQLKPHFDAEG